MALPAICRQCFFMLQCALDFAYYKGRSMPFCPCGQKRSAVDAHSRKVYIVADATALGARISQAKFLFY